MNIKLAFPYIFSLLSFAAVAQEIENDDMYFNAKDRAQLKALEAQQALAYASVKESKKDNRREGSDNPSDSYSARNVNPEYAARSNAQSGNNDDQQYFDQDYRYNTANNFNNWNNNFNNWYGDSWYRPNYYGPSINTWNSPYYGYNDPYSSPWYDPYWNYNGWSTSFSFHYGNSWNYGWGGNYNYWNRPYGGWASAWGPSWGYGSMYNNYYNYPRNVVIVNNYDEDGGRKVSYGRRSSRSSGIINGEGNSSRSRSTVNIPTSGGEKVNTAGRSTNRRQDDYYNRSWKYTSPTNSGNDNGNGSRTSESYNTQRNNSSWNDNSNYSNSRSNNSSYNSGTRQYSSPSSTSGGTNGRTRGRD